MQFVNSSACLLSYQSKQASSDHTLVNAGRERLATEQFDHWIGGQRTGLSSIVTTCTADSIPHLTVIIELARKLTYK